MLWSLVEIYQLYDFKFHFCEGLDFDSTITRYTSEATSPQSYFTQQQPAPFSVEKLANRPILRT